MAEINKDNVTQFITGLHSDTSPSNQPKGTQRFALNTVNETDNGDEFIKGNEESNEPCLEYPEGFIPIGKEYIGANESIVFLVSDDDATSMIGILKDNCVFEVHVNDEDSDPIDKIGFTVANQIQAVYRLRRGCERTVYWTDDNKKPRYYNFDKPYDFKNDDGTWAGRKFNLFKEYNSIPEFRNVDVLDSGGILKPGSVNISIRYIDEGLNPSEWIIASPVINIYNDLSTNDFLDINGSINSTVDYLDFPATTKSIKIELDNLDESYPFYQLAFIEANSGSGFVTTIKYSETIPTSKDFFIYTGENAIIEGNEEEILFFNDIIYKAGSIEQIDNMLILSNTQGKQTNFCKLQKYASRIKADVVTKKVITNNLSDPRNTKNPTVHFGDMITGGTGYMPGEIYSFAIVYVYDDGSLSPAYHIPGKNPTIDSKTVFSPGANTYPMNNNNQSSNNIYIDNDSCANNDYWGLDSEGVSLAGKAVRHHRFPLRSEINLPLVKEETGMGTGEQVFPYYAVQLTGTGNIQQPVVCTPEEIEEGTCTPVAAPEFQARVVYTVDGSEEEMIVNIDPALVFNPVNIVELSNLYTTTDIVILRIEESDENGVVTNVTGITSPKGINYDAQIINTDVTVEGKVFSTEILGIKFSGIDLPSLADTNGEQVIGYYIVRNERVENEKTILDSAVLLPTISNSKYISTGLLAPEIDDAKISKDLFGVLHPEHKFNGKEYNNFDYIKQEGNFDILTRKYSKTSYNDVLDGSSYDSSVHKGGNDDGKGKDGWSLTTILRDNILSYSIKSFFNILSSNVKEMFYLNALESRDINESANTAYNIAADNKIGMIQTDSEIVNPLENNLPYVVIGRNIADSYSNFRTLPYYKDSLNMEKFDNSGESIASIFNGDTYVCPMRYTNSVFWDNRVAKRAGKTSVWNYIIGTVLVVVGAVLSFFTLGASTIVIGSGIAIIGGGALFIASGLKQDAMVKAYNEEYKKGLRETTLDKWVDAFYNYRDNTYTQLFGFVGNGGNGRSGPSDDEIQWIGDTLTDLWFESTVNISLRHKMTSDAPTFLDAPGVIESGNTNKIVTWEFFGNYYTTSVSRYPVSKQDYHMNKKLLVYNSARKDSREYIGSALGEWYQVNPDYHRMNKQKIYQHLPIEYDCCTECMEDFPHRWHWSEQSFQEELSDNYRVFLPNNYKDLEGETGEITNTFKIGNDLFMHTREALWQIPRNYQERVTDQIVSFIGTGSYGDVPARKVVDDETGSSAGSNHKWALIKTPGGVFFPSENQRKFFEFNGQNLKAISDIGIGNWFQNNMGLLMNKQYYDSTGRLFPYNDNPSNPLGTGFISTYDTKKQRIIFTKRDYQFRGIDETPDFEICIKGGKMFYFPDFNQTIQEQSDLGWNYTGIEECRMKFERTVTKTRTETREITVTVPNTAHIYVFYDTSGSFNTGTYLADLRTSVETWYAGFRPDDIGATRLHHINNAAETWVAFGTAAALSPLHTGDVLVISLCNESNPIYHAGEVANPTVGQPTVDFTNNYNQFTTVAFPTLNTFIGINYPIATIGASYANSRAFIQQSLLAVKTGSYTPSEADAVPFNNVFTTGEWNTLKASLIAPNPYNVLGPGLENYNWIVKPDRNDLAVVAGTQDVIITPEQFASDINELLENVTQVIEVEVDVQYQETEFKYIDGVELVNPVEYNNSWTVSYSLKQQSWVSWHSYIPNFYLNVPEKFYSWIYGSDVLWKHGMEGNYQSFYGKRYPFILEYVSLSSPLTTRIWDAIMFLVDAKRYDNNFKEFVDINSVFFDKIIAWNSRQCTGLLNINVKDFDEDSQDYLLEQVTNLNPDEIIVDRNERNWSINNLRDIRTNYNQPIFDSSLGSIQDEYYIDKVLNNNSIDYEKAWTELESFRDKYLVIRLIFDNFAKGTDVPDGSTKLLMNFSAENEIQSFR